MENQHAEVFLTVKEAARLLKSSKKAIYEYISSGRLIATNFSERKTRIKLSDIDLFYEACLYKPTMQPKEHQSKGADS